MRHTQAAIIAQRDKIKKLSAWLKVLVGYDRFLQGESKFNFDNKWFGVRKGDDKDIIIYYWRSGELVAQVLEADIRAEVDKNIGVRQMMKGNDY